MTKKIANHDLAALRMDDQRAEFERAAARRPIANHDHATRLAVYKAQMAHEMAKILAAK